MSTLLSWPRWQEMLANRHWQKARLYTLKEVRVPQHFEKRKENAEIQTPTSALSRSKYGLFQVQQKRTLCSSLWRSKSISKGISAAVEKPLLQCMRPETNFIRDTQVLVYVSVNGITAETLVDTGSMFCHISETF